MRMGFGVGCLWLAVAAAWGAEAMGPALPPGEPVAIGTNVSAGAESPMSYVPVQMSFQGGAKVVAAPAKAQADLRDPFTLEVGSTPGPLDRSAQIQTPRPMPRAPRSRLRERSDGPGSRGLLADEDPRLPEDPAQAGWLGQDLRARERQELRTRQRPANRGGDWLSQGWAPEPGLDNPAMDGPGGGRGMRFFEEQGQSADRSSRRSGDGGLLR